MTSSEIRQAVDRGRRLATTLLQWLDVGVSPEVAIRDLNPNLSAAAIDAARRLAELASFDSACLALVLAGGLVPDEALAVAEIPEPPARAARRTPDELATDCLLRDLGAPPGTVADPEEGDRG